MAQERRADRSRGRADQLHSESAAPQRAKAARPALTVAGAAVGRRKEAVARVRVVPGSGN